MATDADGAGMEANFPRRKSVLVLATFTATFTLSRELNPPGLFWPDKDGARLAGEPEFQVANLWRYEALLSCNAAAFVASQVVILLLLLGNLSSKQRINSALRVAMTLNLFGLIGACAAVSCRSFETFICTITLAAAVLVYIDNTFLVQVLLCKPVKKHSHRVQDVPPQHARSEQHSIVSGEGNESARRTDGGRRNTREALESVERVRRRCLVPFTRLGESITCRVAGLRTPGSVERARNYLLIFATLAAATTYQAWLSTPRPGSQDNDHLTGDHHVDRFMLAFYSLTTAFFASLVVIILIMSKTVTRHGFQSWMLWVCAGAALLGLAHAFVSGSCHSVKTSIYLIALAAAVLFYIVVQAVELLCKHPENLIQNVQGTLGRYLKFEKLKQQIYRQQSRASEHGNGDAYQILKKSRTHLLLLGVLAASVTYQAGLNPVPGDQILRITHPQRYLVFFYCNATAFAASLVIVLLLLLSNVFKTRGIRYRVLQVAITLDLLSLVAAYVAGSCWRLSKSAYASLLLAPVSLYAGIHVADFMSQVFSACAAWRQVLREKMEQSVPGCLRKLFGLPADEHAEVEGEGAEEEEEEEEAEDEEEEEEAAAMERKLEKRRKLLLLLAILAAFLTYAAGMSSPDDNLQTFSCCNATAFVASVSIIAMLANGKFPASGTRRRYALRACVILAVIGLTGALAAGGYRRPSTADVLVMVSAVLLCAAFHLIMSVSETARGLVQTFRRVDPSMEQEGSESEDEMEVGLAGGSDGEPLGVEVSSPIFGGGLTLILGFPVVATLANPVKPVVAMLIAWIVVDAWRKSSYAPSLRAVARDLQRRGDTSQDTNSNLREHVMPPALCRGLGKMIHKLCSGAWMWITVVAICAPALRPNLKLKFKMSSVSAVLQGPRVSIPATATGTSTTSTATSTATDTPTAASTSGTRTGRRVQPPVEPRPRRNRRPNTRLIGQDWLN